MGKVNDGPFDTGFLPGTVTLGKPEIRRDGDAWDVTVPLTARFSERSVVLIGWCGCPECGEIDYREIDPLGLGWFNPSCLYVACDRR